MPFENTRQYVLHEKEFQRYLMGILITFFIFLIRVFFHTPVQSGKCENDAFGRAFYNRKR